MIATQRELTEFHDFARQKLEAGASSSLQDLLDEWNTARAFEDSVARIDESMRQYAAGQYSPIEEVAATIRTKLKNRE